MVHYRYSVSVVSRGKAGGQSVIKRAAYNSRENLKNERTGQTEYCSKGGLEFEAIFAPDGAPEWARDRQKLWNEVERKEDQNRKRDTARLARNIIVSLPHQLDRQQREWLAKDFARELARKGMIVDFSIHAPGDKSDTRNYHMHMLVTMRSIDKDGFGNKVREWDKREELERQRERWSALAAKALKRAGYGVEAERMQEAHKTLKEQRAAAIKRGDMEFAHELDREPQKHLGPIASALARAGVRTVNGDKNLAIQERNEARALARGVERTATGLGKSARRGGRIIGKVLDVATDLGDVLSGPKLTPRQKAQAEAAQIERQTREHEEELKRQMERGRER